jgi:O-antigen/teichoic acid export membrane protein
MSYVISLIAASPKFMMPLIVINVLGPEENAYFYVAWAIATLLFAIPTSMGQSLFAEGSHDKRKLHRDIRRATMLSGLLLVPAVLFVWLLGEVALLAFGGSYSERSIELLRILALAALPMTFERIYFTVLRIRGRLRELTIWRTVLSVVLLSACALLIPAGGLKVIGWVWLATHGAAAAAILMFRSALWTGR